MTNPFGPQNPQDPQNPQNGWSSIPDPQDGGTVDPRNPYGTTGASGASGTPAAPDASGTWQGTTPQQPYGQSAQPEVPAAPPANPYAQPQIPAQPTDPYGQGGYQQAGYQQAGYQQAGYQQPGYQQPQYAPQPQSYVASKSMVVAILLALFLGGFGIHNFYLGYNKDGGLQLAGTILGWALSGLFVGFILVFAVAGWIIFNIFQIATRAGKYATDAQGVPLQ